ncbi:MAG: hypothetical protein M5U12_18005 [Verrucomicrobia bacterium]|nr:hypothetical protein [Verrucomicrobiota bacterium]
MRSLERRGRPAVSYVHPYEVELAYDAAFFRHHLTQAENQRMDRLRWGQYRNRGHTMTKLRCLLTRHRFGSLTQMVAQWRERDAAGQGEGGWRSGARVAISARELCAVTVKRELWAGRLEACPTV